MLSIGISASYLESQLVLMENVFLFTGENSYLLQQEVSRWIQEFKSRHGEENLTSLSAAGLTPSQFLNEIASSPFIAECRLIVIDGIPSFSQEEAQVRNKNPKAEQGMRVLLSQAHPQAIILFVVPKPDRRLSSTKELLALATVRTFSPLSGDTLMRWIQDSFRSLQAQVEPAVPGLLIERVGEDQRMLSQEIAKLSLFATGRHVTPSDVETIVFISSEQTVWHLLDLLGEGRAEEAVLYCRQLLRSGESAHGIWKIFLWIVTSFVSVVAAVSEGATSVQAVMQATGVKYGAARSLLPLARSCRLEHLQDLLLRVTDADIGLKTGAWKAGADSDEELCALLDRCLLRFPGARR